MIKRQHKKKNGRSERVGVRTKKEITQNSGNKVGGRRCRSTVTMRYERNVSETWKEVVKNRIAEGEDELCRRTEWIADEAGEAWF